jgi:hypothetical protein
MKISTGNAVILFILLTVVCSQPASNWKKLSLKGTNYFVNIFAQQTGVSSYYKYKEGSSQRIIIVTLSEGIEGRTKSLTLEIDLMITNA